jgi:hypothetical protein
MARAQFWALREGLKWTRTEIKSKWPFDEIKARWPQMATDPVWMTGLMPAPVDRPLAERWAHNYEVVGLGSAKRAAHKIYSSLLAAANTESARRRLLGFDIEQQVRQVIAKEKQRHQGNVEGIVSELTKAPDSVCSLLSRAWRGSFSEAAISEKALDFFKKIEGWMNQGVEPLRAVDLTISTAKDTILK